MPYRISHRTHYRYAGPVSESFTAVRMQPRSDAGQRLLDFNLRVQPAARVWTYADDRGNTVHHFSITAPHTEQLIDVEALVEVEDPPMYFTESPDPWGELRDLRAQVDWWDWFHPSAIARPSIALNTFRDELRLRSDHPRLALETLNQLLPERIKYESGRTLVDSPLDSCLTQRAGVCQDFAHLFIALARGMGIPARYVSGYLFHRGDDAHMAQDATHAWAEAFVPGQGWVGFDSSNGVLAGNGHIRVALGRDYSDVPPARGVYRGAVSNDLAVSVQVSRVPTMPTSNTTGSHPMSELAAEVIPTEEGVLLRLGGTLGVAELLEFERVLDQVKVAPAGRLVVDLSGIRVLTSAGLGALLRMQTHFTRQECAVRLAAAPPAIDNLLRKAALDRVFTLASSVADAFA